MALLIMLLQCVSETVSNSWLRGAVIWSDNCVPLSLEVAVLSVFLLYLIGFLHKFLVPFLTQTNFGNSIGKILKYDDSEVSNLSGVTILKLLIFLIILSIYLIFIIALSSFAADFILNSFGWTIANRINLFSLFS
jgi:hypothetical protein